MTELTRMFDPDNTMTTFGIVHIPTTQRYGILFGFLCFLCTVTAMLMTCTRIMGGSFRWIVKQAETDTNTRDRRI